MATLKWLCKFSPKATTVVKIVHPGGNVEVHDSPVLAAEIMLQNPRCVVAYPHVFQEPWAIVPPDTVLNLGEKFYVVPTTTIRKLQRESFKSSATAASPLMKEAGEGEEKQGNNCSSSCSFVRCVNGGKGKGGGSEEGISSSSSSSSFGCCDQSQSKGLVVGKKEEEFKRGSPKRFSSLDSWQPSLEIVIEESL